MILIRRLHSDPHRPGLTIQSRTTGCRSRRVPEGIGLSQARGSMNREGRFGASRNPSLFRNPSGPKQKFFFRVFGNHSASSDVLFLGWVQSHDHPLSMAHNAS